MLESKAVSVKGFTYVGAIIHTGEVEVQVKLIFGNCILFEVLKKDPVLRIKPVT